MKTIRFKMTPTEIKAGRQKVFSWQNTIVTGNLSSGD